MDEIEIIVCLSGEYGYDVMMTAHLLLITLDIGVSKILTKGSLVMNTYISIQLKNAGERKPQYAHFCEKYKFFDSNIDYNLEDLTWQFLEEC